ncbi:hypothetical protein LTR36_003401 [Oleoguttula mirabilis]|uniref:Rhamnogalacturonase A/B/Epimerase-like pectate lyase domain-containing protein n=1 Tax=Oleoguttula mirabilis TaxID=1507867 RepID=A0AAV9JJ51_9PEZI|nr:hypothetical protein LTR36_003401 [Oleoguttula mirabilis]
MFFTRSTKLCATALCAILSLSSVAAAPTPQATTTASSSSTYWLADTSFHKNAAIYGNDDTDYKLFRNVKQFGAVGDGVTDDTDAINLAINSTGVGDIARCGVGCNSSTITPALVYFPSGTYLVSSPLIMLYYTQMVGDPTNLPTIVGSSGFKGIALLDADPYGNYGVNWYINQNNFFRQVRNFIIDVSKVDGGDSGAGIHWQVAQATSLQNIRFEMSTSTDTKQQGIFMDNGSGGFMGDLVFVGGKYGAFLGNQQFTSRNMTFKNCQTAIYMNWNWGWTLSGITVDSCTNGIDMSNSPQNQTVGSVVVADSTFTNVEVGIISAFTTTGNVPATGGTLILDNVDMTGAAAAVQVDNSTILAGNQKIVAWASGNVYDNSATKKVTQGTITTPTKASSLLDGNKNVFGRSKPQYETASTDDFLHSMDEGLKGDGVTDDTVAMQTFLDKAASQGKIAYFDHGIYPVNSTIHVPVNGSGTTRIVGEVWSTILAHGFTNTANPVPVWQIGAVGSSGSIEISDMLFEIKGRNPGAIMIQWNVASQQGASGLWDTHVRMGGSVDSGLQLSDCPVSQGASPLANCQGGFLMMHITKQASNVYLENTWFWTADHDMEDPANLQISVYNGRGMLVQATGPVWLWGTSSEHSVLYNYQFDGCQAVFAGFMQSETPYYQPVPVAPAPFSFNSAYDDPTFTVCSSDAAAVPCKDAWGLRVLNSKNVLIYSAGFYSFFNDYTQACVTGENCQQNMVHIQNSQVSAYAITTKASVNMILDDLYPNTPVLASDNRGVYGDVVAYYNTKS